MRFWKSKSFTVGVIIVCSAILIGLLWANHQQEQRRLAQMSALQQQAAPYEQEIRELQSELDKREKAIFANTDTSGAIPCFKASSVEDVEVVKRLSADDSFVPTILLDCAMDEGELYHIIEASAAENFDFVLLIFSMNENTLDTIDDLQKKIAGYNAAWEPVLLLRHSDDTETNRALLEEHGYQNVFRYSDTLEDGIQNEMLYLPYGFLRSTTSSNRLTEMLVAAHTSMAIGFDLDDLRDNTLTEKNITDCLNTLDERVSAKVLEYRDINTAFSVLAQKEGKSERAKAEFDRYAQQQEMRIEELWDIVNEIYSHWDEY